MAVAPVNVVGFVVLCGVVHAQRVAGCSQLTYRLALHNGGVMLPMWVSCGRECMALQCSLGCNLLWLCHWCQCLDTNDSFSNH